MSTHPLPALHLLARYLEGRERAGQSRIWMSAEALAALREIIRMKPGRMVFREPVPAVTHEIDGKNTKPAAPAPPATPAPSLSSSPTRAVSPSHLLPISEKTARLAAVAARAELAPAARALGTLRDRMVFAVGSPDADIVFVGEAPGADEEKQGEPFVGVAGQLLTKVIQAMGLERSRVYITNICKFRPVTDDGRPQGTRNRPPTGAEMNTCLEYVQEEIAIIQPRVIVALGKSAMEGLLQRDVAITRLRGQWQEYRGIPLMPTFHPSYLKRKEDDGAEAARLCKRQHWEDMLAVMERLRMPISAKQRAFFLPRSQA